MYLKKINPTPEQRKIFFLEPNRPVLVSGRAGSGKTTTAILRAAQLVSFYRRQGIDEPSVGIFVFNNTLSSYLTLLTKEELNPVNTEVWVFDNWCKTLLKENDLLTEEIADEADCKSCLKLAVQAIDLSSRSPELVNLGLDFLMSEVRYLLGRFGLDTKSYINSDRIGRGDNPYIDFHTKEAIALDLVPNYTYILATKNYIDWQLVRNRTLSNIKNASIAFNKYDVLVLDEAQDLSAVQIKLALELVSTRTNSVTFIRDSTQRIYENDYVWNDVNLSFGINSKIHLEKNYRNTLEIALVAANLMESLLIKESEISILDPKLTKTTGLKPVWFRGKYRYQKRYLYERLRNIDYNLDSVGILHIKAARAREINNDLISLGFPCIFLKDYTVIQETTGIVYTSTLNSVKGLEFDHVFIVGYDSFFAPGNVLHRDTSAHLLGHQKLLYTAITRAKKTLTITSSINEYSSFLDEIDINLLEIINCHLWN